MTAGLKKKKKTYLKDASRVVSVGVCAAAVDLTDHAGQMTDLQHVFLWYELGFVGQVRWPCWHTLNDEEVPGKAQGQTWLGNLK